MISFTTAIDYTKQAIDLISSFNKLKTQYEIQQQSIQLLETIDQLQKSLVRLQTDYLALQARYSDVLQRKNELESQLIQFKNGAIRHLHQLDSGAWVYRTQTSVGNRQTVQNECQHCYQNGKYSVLQVSGVENGFHVLSCPVCRCRILGDKVVSKVDVMPNLPPDAPF